MENIEPTKVTEENGEQKSENTENGEAPTGDENGNVTQENQENGEQTNGEALKGKTVEGILAKVCDEKYVFLVVKGKNLFVSGIF